MSERFNRRRFVGRMGAAAATFPILQRTGKAAANDRLRLGLIGCGGRGRQLADVFQQYPEVDLAAVCDVNEPRLDRAARRVVENGRERLPERVIDYQRILDRSDIDAVVIATTQHWHGLPFIHAAQAGKAIYVEKPLSHTVEEGRAMVNAAKKTGVMALMGTQQRNYPHYEQAASIIGSGRLGDIALVECWNYHNTGNRVGHHSDTEPPEGLHWDKWLGPAPYVPYNPARMNNSWWFDYAGGMLTNWAVHHLDIILSVMEVEWPSRVACPGGKFVVDDMADTPDTVEASWQFPNFVMHYAYRGFNNFHTVPSRPQHHGICFHGNQATMILDRSGFEIWEERNPAKSVEKVSNDRYWRDGKPGNEVDGPWQRLFVDCVLEGQQPPIDLEESHRATACCHLANIAYLAEGGYRWDGDREQISDRPEVAKLLSRPRRQGYELPTIG